jgi:hypothetical protein
MTAIDSGSCELNERIDILKHLSQLHRNEANLRRKDEWRTVIATLALYALTVGAKLEGGIEVDIPSLQVWAWSLLLAALISTYLWFAHRANDTNRQFADAAEDELMSIVGVEPLAAARNAAKRARLARFNWSLWGQVVLIAAFAIVAAALFNAPVVYDEDDSSNNRLAAASAASIEDTQPVVDDRVT